MNRQKCRNQYNRSHLSLISESSPLPTASARPANFPRSHWKVAVQWISISFNRLNGHYGLNLGRLYNYEHSAL